MKIITAVILVFISFNVLASDLVSSVETKKLCSNAVSLLAKGKVEESFNILKPYWPMPVAEITNLAYQTKTQLAMVSKRFGQTLGIDFIRTQKVGSSFIKHTYIVKYEKTAIRYLCVFYKPKSRWLVNTITWDDKITHLFD